MKYKYELCCNKGTFQIIKISYIAAKIKSINFLKGFLRKIVE